MMLERDRGDLAQSRGRHSTRRVWTMVRALAACLVAAASACGPGPDETGHDAGPDGAAAGSGGRRGTGGVTGAGGATATGGTGAGGATGTGGAIGTGGATGSGGRTPMPDAASDTRDAATTSDAASDALDAGMTSDAADGGSTGTGIVAAGVRWVGRVDVSNPQRPRFSWSGTGFVARFSGTSLAMQINSSGAFIFKAVVDGTPRAAFTIPGGQQTANVVTGLAAGVHTVELYRQTEGSQGDSQLLSLTVGGGALMNPPGPPARLIEVIGDSISCGYGTLGALADSDCFPTESHWDTYAAVAARALRAEINTIAMSGQGAYRNYGGDMTNTLPMVYTRALTNDTTPLWDFGPQAQAVIVNLGTNDISNSKGDPGTPFRTAYTGLLQTVRSKYPGALIVCIIGPLLSGTDLTTIQGHIRAAVDARASAGDGNVEFFDQIAPQTSDKAACQYHPNVAENQIMADQIAAELRARLRW
jgi:lysophospholipase L1-like esterase